VKNSSKKWIKISSVTTAAVFFILILYWQNMKPDVAIIENIPGMDKPSGEIIQKIESIKIGEKFEKLTEETSSLNSAWSAFRGTDRKNIATSTISINENWDAKPPKLVWKAKMGEGHAAPAIWKGIAYILDYDEVKKEDVLRSFNIETGKELWRRSYKVHLKRNHGMSRTVPAVTEKFIVTLGPRGHVMCMERTSGNLLWVIDIEKEYESEIPFWYTGQCPLIDNETAIIATGGKNLLIAVDCNTGKILWQSPNEKKWKMSHSSVMPMIFEDVKMYVYAAVGGLCGIEAEGENAGKILFEITDFSPQVVAPSPVQLDKSRIFITAGYGAGSAVITIKKSDTNFLAKTEKKFTPGAGAASEQQTPVMINGFMYIIMPKDAGAMKNQFICFHPSDCGKAVWSSGKKDRYGLGPYMVINDKFLILNDDGTLTMLKVSDKNFIKITERKLFEGQDAWGPLAFADGYLLLRDSKNLFCFDLK